MSAISLLKPELAMRRHDAAWSDHDRIAFTA
jgi:hypothetical protein